MAMADSTPKQALDGLLDRLKPHLPRKHCRWNDQHVRTYRPRAPRVRPDFENPIASRLREHITDGNHLVVVGGGHGVCSAIAARNGATVTTYEASTVFTSIARQTARLNDVADAVTVHHALVGPAIEVWGRLNGAERVSPDLLPACDWLVLDCEGAERDILDSMTVRPRRISVEVHPDLIDANAVRDRVRELGYQMNVVDGPNGTHVIHGTRPAQQDD